MKYTLLEIVRRVLSAMEADVVNDISETFESLAIARVVEEVYFDLISRSDWPHLETTTGLASLSDSSKPNFLEIPEGIKYLKKIWYNNKELTYKRPEEFYPLMNSRKPGTYNTEEVQTPSGATIVVVNNKDPEFFTLINDTLIVTDSYDKDYAATLMGSLALAICNKAPTFIFDNDFIPDIPESMFVTYLAMVKRASFLYFKREPSSVDERAALSGLGRLLQDKNKLFRLENKISYGRKK